MYTSNDTLRTLRAWRQQRFAHTLFVPVAITLVAASLVGTEWPGVAAVAARVAAAWVVVLALRLWDDLEDRQRDAVDHPDRVVTQVPSARPYAALVAILLMLALLVAALGGGLAWVWPVLVCALMLFYRLKGQTRAGGDFVVLLKYPLIALALGGGWQLASLAALAVTLATVCVDEVLQRPSPQHWGVIAGTVTLAGAACLMIAQTQAMPVEVVAVQLSLVGGMIALPLQRIFGKPRLKLTRGGLLAMTFATLSLCTSRFAELINAN